MWCKDALTYAEAVTNFRTASEGRLGLGPRINPVNRMRGGLLAPLAFRR
jgi:hypothetical protein